MKLFYILNICIYITISLSSAGQGVSINESGVLPDSSAMLDISSGDKGLLIPRMELSATGSADPVVNPAVGLTVFNTATTGDVIPGYYFWKGTSWERIMSGTPVLKTVTVTVSDTLDPSAAFVNASNDITLTLPVVSSSYNGLMISVKNSGTPNDLVTIQGAAGSTIDGKQAITLTRWRSCSLVAIDGNWFIREGGLREQKLFDVTADGSWTTLEEVIEFLNNHMTGPSVIRLDGGSYEVSQTITIDLPYSLTIQGPSYGATSIESSPGLTGPVFNCISESYFKMLDFIDNTGGIADALELSGSGVYYEVKDAYLEGFGHQINVTGAGAEAWLFELDMADASEAAIRYDGGSIVRVSEVDFYDCVIGVHLLSGQNPTFSINNCGFYNETGNTGILYVPATFAPFSSIIITNNAWNNTGEYITGFDFTQTDGRDAKAYIQNNAGMGDQTPSSHINVLNNTTATVLGTPNAWYKAQWVNTSAVPTKMTITNNKITYQPVNSRSLTMFISGNLLSSQQNRTISVAIIKNGNTAVRYGETTVRITTTNQPFQWSTVVFVPQVNAGDYFELYCTSDNTTNVTFQDVNWYSRSQ